MALDVQEITGTKALAAARLCNFVTGGANLLPAHIQWLDGKVRSLVAGNPRAWIDVIGHASRQWKHTGGADAHALNRALSDRRCTAVKTHISNYNASAHFNVVLAEGDSQALMPNPNDGYDRAVEVFVYASGPPPTVPPITPRPPAIKMYIGPGIKGGGFLGVAGTQALEAHLYSVDDYKDQFNLDGEIWTAGLGLGGGANVELVIAFGGTSAGSFLGTKFEGWDFNVSLGGRWGDVLKGAKGVPSLVRIAKALQEAKFAKSALRALLKLSPSEWEQLGNLAKALRDVHNADANAVKPQVNSFDIPLAGLALEVDVLYYWGTVKTIY